MCCDEHTYTREILILIQSGSVAAKWMSIHLPVIHADRAGATTWPHTCVCPAFRAQYVQHAMYFTCLELYLVPTELVLL